LRGGFASTGEGGSALLLRRLRTDELAISQRIRRLDLVHAGGERKIAGAGGLAALICTTQRRTLQSVKVGGLMVPKADLRYVRARGLRLGRSRLQITASEARKLTECSIAEVAKRLATSEGPAYRLMC